MYEKEFKKRWFRFDEITPDVHYDESSVSSFDMFAESSCCCFLSAKKI